MVNTWTDRPAGRFDVRQIWTGGTYEMRGAVPITCGDESGIATALVYRFDVLDGKRGIGVLSVEAQEVPPLLRTALRECVGTLSIAVDIGGIVVPAGSYVTAWAVADRGPVSFTVGPVNHDDVSAMMDRLARDQGLR